MAAPGATAATRANNRDRTRVRMVVAQCLQTERCSEISSSPCFVSSTTFFYYVPTLPTPPLPSAPRPRRYAAPCSDSRPCLPVARDLRVFRASSHASACGLREIEAANPSPSPRPLPTHSPTTSLFSLLARLCHIFQITRSAGCSPGLEPRSGNVVDYRPFERAFASLGA